MARLQWQGAFQPSVPFKYSRTFSNDMSIQMGGSQSAAVAILAQGTSLSLVSAIFIFAGSTPGAIKTFLDMKCLNGIKGFKWHVPF